jgi:hypothetical protein
MSTIDLSVSEIERWPAAALAKIEGRMLFPGDSDDYQRLRRLCVLSRLGTWAIDEFSHRWQDLERDLIPQMVEALFNEIEREREEAYRRGFYAGHKLLSFVGDKVLDSARRTLLSVSGRRAEHHVFPGMSDRTLDTYWGLYRPVAHFWMAYLLVARDRLGEGAPFPVRVEELCDLLATAEVIRRECERLAPERSAAVLRGEGLTLPAAVAELALSRGTVVVP